MSKWRWATFRRRRKESSAALERYLSNGFVRKSLCYGIDHRKATVAARYTEEVRRLLQFGVLARRGRTPLSSGLLRRWRSLKRSRLHYRIAPGNQVHAALFNRASKSAKSPIHSLTTIKTSVSWRVRRIALVAWRYPALSAKHRPWK